MYVITVINLPLSMVAIAGTIIVVAVVAVAADVLLRWLTSARGAISGEQIMPCGIVLMIPETPVSVRGQWCSALAPFVLPSLPSHAHAIACSSLLHSSSSSSASPLTSSPSSSSSSLPFSSLCMLPVTLFSGLPRIYNSREPQTD